MLIHPTLETLQRLRLRGMYKALQEQLQMPETDSLCFEDRLALLLEREVTERESRRLRSRLKQAKLRENAAIEDIDYRANRGLDKALMTRLAACQWIGEHLNVLITGPTGVGKTWIACALANRPAARASAHVICACPDCCRSSASPAPTGVTRNCSPSWPEPICSSSTTGD